MRRPSPAGPCGYLLAERSRRLTAAMVAGLDDTSRGVDKDDSLAVEWDPKRTAEQKREFQLPPWRWGRRCMGYMERVEEELGR